MDKDCQAISLEAHIASILRACGEVLRRMQAQSHLALKTGAVSDGSMPTEHERPHTSTYSQPIL